MCHKDISIVSISIFHVQFKDRISRAIAPVNQVKVVD